MRKSLLANCVILHLFFKKVFGGQSSPADAPRTPAAPSRGAPARGRNVQGPETRRACLSLARDTGKASVLRHAWRPAPLARPQDAPSVLAAVPQRRAARPGLRRGLRGPLPAPPAPQAPPVDVHLSPRPEKQGVPAAGSERSVTRSSDPGQRRAPALGGLARGDVLPATVAPSWLASAWLYRRPEGVCALEGAQVGSRGGMF